MVSAGLGYGIDRARVWYRQGYEGHGIDRARRVMVSAGLGYGIGRARVWYRQDYEGHGIGRARARYELVLDESGRNAQHALREIQYDIHLALDGVVWCRISLCAWLVFPCS